MSAQAEELVEPAASGVERVLFAFGDSWPDERAAVFVNQFSDGLGHGHFL